MPDPRIPNPEHPDRPTHEDFAVLAESAQTIDAFIEQLGFSAIDVAGVDEESVMYFVRNRLHLEDPPAAVVRFWLDAFTLGVKFAERRKETAQ